MTNSWNLRLQAVAALEEPTRRRLYEYVVSAPAPVGRDDAAAALGIPRTTAAFHLDKLTDEGLLDTCYERRSGRTGPGAGRPAKLYHRSDREFEISLPERHYAVAGHLLAAALEEAETAGGSPREAVNRQAHSYGRSLAGGRELVDVLAGQGFEPRVEADGIALGNCPFRRLAADYPKLVCGMTFSLLSGLAEGYAEAGLQAVPDPQPAGCCVRLVSSRGGEE